MGDTTWARSKEHRASFKWVLDKIIEHGDSSNEARVDLARDTLTLLAEFERLSKMFDLTKAYVDEMSWEGSSVNYKAREVQRKLRELDLEPDANSSSQKETT